MVEYFVRDVRWHPKPCHAGYDSPAEIVDSPFSNARKMVEVGLGGFERLKILATRSRKNKTTVLWLSFDDLPGPVGQVNDMGLRVLGPVRRDVPSSDCLIDLAPNHLRNFFAALAGECENFKDGAEGTWHISSGENYRRQFLIIQGAVARTIRRAKIESLDGREIDHGSPYAPPKEGF
jgi:hypothetical protein